MMVASPFLQTLDAAANQAAAAESAFRRESADRIKQLERDRSFAFRRLTLMRTMSEAAARAESEELAVAATQAILRTKLGWSSDSEARSMALTQFAPVAKAMFANLHPEPETPAPDILASLVAFENWYQDAYGTSFWALLDQPVLETPLVDF